MPKLRPCKRRDFIRKLKKIGFKAPEPGGRHFYMRYGIYTLTLPSNKEYSVPQVKMLIKEIERGIHQKIPLDEWESL
ncbi:MAG: type II toxin-antitoxin system HicA family toxin [Deltaproteobacteria bacterium]|nr:type II toxin-antitoxin system HicA family toxin [Deltaproteobacteria bacterium]MBW1939737.1 type II toxin-antitoxin system HicA family toxin [Deltaproteobacteria bacterium]MBW1965752.1 type II toxin-antitoxin system HicA family toxin [Deltaproteobacteria bacterium]